MWTIFKNHLAPVFVMTSTFITTWLLILDGCEAAVGFGTYHPVQEFCETYLMKTLHTGLFSVSEYDPTFGLDVLIVPLAVAFVAYKMGSLLSTEKVQFLKLKSISAGILGPILCLLMIGAFGTVSGFHNIIK